MLLTKMESEAREAPEVLAKQFSANKTVLQEVVRAIQKIKPTVCMTIARGSSDHAATFAKYLLETRAGIMTASAAPSVLTIYQKKLSVKNCLVLGISQSGASPDIVEMMTIARAGGGITVAFVNEINSPLAAAAEYVVPLNAGVERAVAATKTYLATLGALIQFIAMLTQDNALLDALERFPTILKMAAEQDWSAAVAAYLNAKNTFVIGRGYSFPAAQEAALKFKETAKIHAEAFSSAELLHGPFALVEKNFPLLMFAQQDESFAGTLAIATRMKNMGANILLASPQRDQAVQTIQDAASIYLPLPQGLHPICDPLLIVQAFYVMMARLSVARGLNPDEPSDLTKVTKTW